MSWRCNLSAAAAWFAVLSFVSPCQCEDIGVYDAQKIVAERTRLEERTKELWQVMYDHLLTHDEKAALRQARLQFPALSPDGSPLNFYASAGQGIVYLPIHSLLMLEDVCTAYAWLHQNGYSAITVNEFASMLKYRRPDAYPGGILPRPLKALQIPEDALSDEQVDQMSLRFRNSAFAYVLAHEMGHILYRHPGNTAVHAAASRGDEREADAFAVRVLRRDRQVPMGAILFFQMTAFVASPGRFDYPTVGDWRTALQKATHPVTSDRVRGLTEGLRTGDYGVNQAIALEIAVKLQRIADEMDDRDWQLYFKRIGQRAPLSRLRPRQK